MMRKTLWSIVTFLLTCSTATAADIRRVVTGLDAGNKAIALFDNVLTLSVGRTGNAAPISGSRIHRRPASHSRTTAPPSRSAFRRRTTAPSFAWSNSGRLIPPPKRKWIRIS